MQSFATTLLILAAMQGWGEFALRRAGIARVEAPLGRLWRVALAAACGHALCGLALLAIGVVGGYGTAASLALLLPGLLLAAWFAWEAGSALFEERRADPHWRAADLLAPAFALIAGVLVLAALVPDIEIDDITYHQTVPRAYLNAGGIIRAPYEPLSSWNQLSSMAHLWALSLHPTSTVPPKLLELARALLGVIGAAGAAGFLFGRGTGAVVLLLGALCETTARYATTSHTDAGMALYVSAGLGCLMRWLEEPHARWREGALGGFLLGCCFGVKQTGLFIAAPPLALAAGLYYFQQGSAAPRARRILHAAVPALSATAAMLPWMLKNWILTGTPLYPFLLALWPPNAEGALAHTFVGRYYPPDRPLAESLGMPMSHLYVVVSNVRLNTATGIALFTPLAALLLMMRGERRRTGDLFLVLTFAAYVVLLFKVPFWRFLAGVYAMGLVMLAGQAARAVPPRHVRIAAVGAAMVVAWFATSWWEFVRYGNHHHRAFDSPGHILAWTADDEARYYQAHHPDAAIVFELNRTLGEGTLLLASFESAALPLLSIPFLPNAPCIAQEGIETMEANGWDAAAMAAHLRAAGITHIATRERLDSGEGARLLRGHFDLVKEWPGTGVRLLALR